LSCKRPGGGFVKSFLGMLLVAGVFALSLVAFQDEAGAEEMVSSWYGPGLEGNPAANGEVFDPYNDHTAASLHYPIGTKLRVCYAACTVVRVNDRGPYVDGVELDLSQAAAEEIGLIAAGTDVVDVRVLDKRPSLGRAFGRAV
jgi:rare lipoprotein A